MRGLSPIIAVVLLIMMTVAAAGAAYVWIIALQKKMSGSASQQAQILSSGFVQYVSASCVSPNNITTIIRNVGKTTIPSGNITLEVKDAATNTHLNTFYKYSNSLAPQAIVTYTFNTSDSSQSLESKTTTLTKDQQYTLTITMPDGSYDVTTCTAS